MGMGTEHLKSAALGKTRGCHTPAVTEVCEGNEGLGLVLSARALPGKVLSQGFDLAR